MYQLPIPSNVSAGAVIKIITGEYVGILLGSFLLMVIGIVLYNVFDYELVNLWITISVIGGVIFFIASMGFAVVGLDSIDYPVEHEVYIEYLETIQDNNQLTDGERTKAISKIISKNSYILNNRKFRNNFWISAFYPKHIGDLELIDISIVPNAKYQVGIE